MAIGKVFVSLGLIALVRRVLRFLVKLIGLASLRLSFVRGNIDLVSGELIKIPKKIRYSQKKLSLY
jgi:hypothetical protein